MPVKQLTATPRPDRDTEEQIVLEQIDKGFATELQLKTLITELVGSDGSVT